MTSPDDIESALIDKARRGDRQALDSLLRRHQPTIHAVCRRVTGNDADALDATQEALIAVVRGLGNFDGRSRFSTWVYRIATNASLDELRRRARRPIATESSETTDGDVAALTGDRPGDQVVARVTVDGALASLAEEFRVAVVLRDLCDLSYEEIAEVLDVPVGTVRSRIARGRGQLADLLADKPGNYSPSTQRPSSAP